MLSELAELKIDNAKLRKENQRLHKDLQRARDNTDRLCSEISAIVKAVRGKENDG